MQTVRLPLIEHEDAFWDFIEILFEELRCGMFYTREKRPEPKSSKKRRSSTETPTSDKLSLESGAQKRQRVQVSLERMNLKKSLLSLGKERMVRNDDSTTAVATTAGSISSSSSSPVHSPAAQSVSPASSTASSRQDGVSNRSTTDISVADLCLRMSVRRSQEHRISRAILIGNAFYVSKLGTSTYLCTGTYF